MYFFIFNYKIKYSPMCQLREGEGLDPEVSQIRMMKVPSLCDPMKPFVTFSWTPLSSL